MRAERLLLTLAESGARARVGGTIVASANLKNATIADWNKRFLSGNSKVDSSVYKSNVSEIKHGRAYRAPGRQLATDEFYRFCYLNL